MDHPFVDGLAHHSHTLNSSHHHHHHHSDSEWEAKEQLRLRELEEARTRAAQMEKTMRWWSDCTANWREKWSKVRTERNKAREEVRLLRTKYETLTKEINNLKRDKQDLESELQRVKSPSQSHNGIVNVSREVPERDVPLGDFQDFNLDGKNCNSPSTNEFAATDLKFFDRIFQANCPQDDEEKEEDDEINLNTDNNSISLDLSLSRMSMNDTSPDKLKQTSSLKYIPEISSPDTELLKQRLSELELRLEEASKTLQLERDENTSLHKAHDKVQEDYNELKLKYEELKSSRHEIVKELSQVKSEHQDEMENLRLDIEEEVNTRSSLDRKLCDLRGQLERLQSENALEWGKRERLETEKINLERENKKLRCQMEELQERLERKAKTSGVEMDPRALQHEIYDKNKELSDLRHSHCKLKKVLQEKSTELSHASRRAEQYETEVKKLRCRVEELKKELANAEDEIDSATNTIRKMQRTNDELQEQVDNLQVQVDHLQTRLRNNSHSLLTLRGSNCLLNDAFSEDDNAEF